MIDVILYIVLCVVDGIIDIVVCGTIFYSVTCCNGSWCFSCVEQLYSLNGMQHMLSHWIEVYGATSVTKLASFWGLTINPFLVLIINSYLYGTSIDINYVLNPECSPNMTQTVTCQVFNNQTQYKLLETLNKIQLFGSFTLLGIIVVVWILIYLYDVSLRIYEKFCCKCCKRMCDDCNYVFCYGP